MGIFIAITASITVITLLIMTRPLLKNRNTVSYERQAQNIHFAKERLAELEGQLKNASISATDYEALKLEIETTLADDIGLSGDHQTNQTPAKPRSNKVILAVLCVLLPMMALGFYFLTGTPAAFDDRVATQSQPSADDINVMIERIETRLAENPDDIEGWTVLSRTYLALGRYSKAKQGFEKLLELQGESADVYVSLADASGLMAGGNLSGEPSMYLEQAMKLDPTHPQALWLTGLSAAQQNKLEKAREYWNQLMPLLESSPEQQAELETIIKETFTSDSLAIEDIQGLRVTINLSPKVVNLVDSQDTIFVFARAKQGPPAPLAVKRLTVSDLPTTITLNDEDAMMLQLSLSKFNDVVVSARVSKSGQPLAQPGDIQSQLIDSKNSNQEEIQLLIENVIQ